MCILWLTQQWTTCLHSTAPAKSFGWPIYVACSRPMACTCRAEANQLPTLLVCPCHLFVLVRVRLTRPHTVMVHRATHTGVMAQNIASCDIFAIAASNITINDAVEEACACYPLFFHVLLFENCCTSCARLSCQSQMVTVLDQLAPAVWHGESDRG